MAPTAPATSERDPGETRRPCSQLHPPAPGKLWSGLCCQRSVGRPATGPLRSGWPPTGPSLPQIPRSESRARPRPLPSTPTPSAGAAPAREQASRGGRRGVGGTAGGTATLGFGVCVCRVVPRDGQPAGRSGALRTWAVTTSPSASLVCVTGTHVCTSSWPRLHLWQPVPQASGHRTRLCSGPRGRGKHL